MFSKPPEPPAEPMERKTSDPAHLIGLYQTMQPAVKITLAQAGALGAAAMIFFLSVVWVVSFPRQVASWAALIFTLVVLVILAIGLLFWRLDNRRLLGILEDVFKRDLNGDGQTGSAKTIRYIVRVEVTISDNHGKSIAIQFAEITDIEPDKLQVVAARMLMGRSSVREMSDLLGPAQYKRFMDVADKYKWRTPKSEKDVRQGFALTRVGQAVMTQLSNGITVLENDDE